MFNYGYSKRGNIADSLLEIALEKEANALDCFKAVFENIFSNYVCYVVEKDSPYSSEIDYVSFCGKGVKELYICKENDFKLLKDETCRIKSIDEIKKIYEYNNEVKNLLKDLSVKQSITILYYENTPETKFVLITNFLESLCDRYDIDDSESNSEDEIEKELQNHLDPLTIKNIIANKSLKENLSKILLKSDPTIVEEMRQIVSNPLKWHYNFNKDDYVCKVKTVVLDDTIKYVNAALKLDFKPYLEKDSFFVALN